MTTSTKPYLIRALWSWCVDNGYTPHLAVWVDERTQVPRQFVRDNEIVLNIGNTATHGLDIGNDWITFSARFGGVAHAIRVPVGNVVSVFARETGEGMGFEVEVDETPERPALQAVEDRDDDPTPPAGPDAGGTPPARGKLRIVK